MKEVSVYKTKITHKTMGLDSLVDEYGGKAAESYKQYGEHEYDDILERWIEEFQQRFPERVDIEFVEVSPNLDKSVSRWYWRTVDNEEICYLRISDRILNGDDWYIRQVLLHAMTHIYLRQIGANDIDASPSIKKWVCGRVGCMINAVNTNSDEWKFIAEPFLEEDMRSGEMWL